MNTAPRKHVLIVDDDPEARGAFGSFLERKGYRVTESANALEAIRSIRRGDVDLLLTDYHMPEVNGMELLREARRSHPELPVIVISGAADLRTALQIQKEAFDFLTKPVDSGELIEVLKLALAQRDRPVAADKDEFARGVGPVYLHTNQDNPGISICEFNRPLDEYSQKAFEAALRRIQTDGDLLPRVVIVLRNVSYINSVGLGFLLALYEDWKTKHRLVFTQLSDPVYRYFKTLGYLDYLPTAPTLPEALEFLS